MTWTHVTGHYIWRSVSHTVCPGLPALSLGDLVLPGPQTPGPPTEFHPKDEVSFVQLDLGGWRCFGASGTPLLVLNLQVLGLRFG